jgi:hypothetical protein
VSGELPAPDKHHSSTRICPGASRSWNDSTCFSIMPGPAKDECQTDAESRAGGHALRSLMTAAALGVLVPSSFVLGSCLTAR